VECRECSSFALATIALVLVSVARQDQGKLRGDA